MKVKVLGTAAGSGVPGIFCSCDGCNKARVLKGKELRGRSQFLVNDDVLVDFSNDTIRNSMIYGINMSKIKHLLITHYHTDHYDPTIFRYKNASQMDEPVLYVYSPPDVEEMYNNCDVIKPKTREYIQFVKTTEYNPIEAPPYKIHPMFAPHFHKGEKTSGKKFYIYVLEKDGKRVLFGMDSYYFTDEIFDYLKGMKLDLIFLDCTHGLRVREFEGTHAHMCFNENLMIKERFLQNGTADSKTIFVSTHFSDRYAGQHEEMNAEMEKHGFFAAYDGMDFEI